MSSASQFSCHIVTILDERPSHAYAQVMAAFDDSLDPNLGAACNRLAAWVEPLPAGAVIDPTSGLTEENLALILRHLHATRHAGPNVMPERPLEPRSSSRPSVPITARD